MALLVIVGAVLAFVLFAAGALWRGRSSAERPKTSINYLSRGEKPEPNRRTTRDNDCGLGQVGHTEVIAKNGALSHRQLPSGCGHAV
jgi:hypothetical protein